MNVHTVALVCITALCIHHANGQCYVVEKNPEHMLNTGMTSRPGCTHKGNYIAPKGHHTHNCETCFCGPNGLSCCVNGMHIVSAPSECKIVPDTCGEKAVKIDNEDEECIADIQAVSRR